MSKTNNTLTSRVTRLFGGASTPVNTTVVRSAQDRSTVRPAKASIQAEIDRLTAENAALKAKQASKAAKGAREEVTIETSPFDGSDQVVFKGRHSGWKGYFFSEAQILEVIEFSNEILSAARQVKH